MIESAVVAGFTAVALAGFKKTLWLAAAGLDVFAGVWLGFLLLRRQSGTHSRRSPG